jgi:16S rRNA (cytosine1402-N4)-methyltransferase
MVGSPDENRHIPVMPSEVLHLLAPANGEVIVDATLGLAGHTRLILAATKDVRVIGIEQDPHAVEAARTALGSDAQRVDIARANFSQMKAVLEKRGLVQVNGVLADLGVSSLQLDDAERGFSFRFDAPLDMRMDPDSDAPTAAELLETLDEHEIADIIYRFGEERNSRRIARRIVERRERGQPLRTTAELAELVERASRRPRGAEKIHPATRTFQALRIAVNRELDILAPFIEDAVSVLVPGGRLVIITFHSLEDRIVKQQFQRLSGKCSCPPKIPKCRCGAVKKIEILTKRPLTPSDEEMRINPRSRSAKLRAAKRPTYENPRTE